jgi:DNA helicase-2/ATP-dependent DNA helicase PcrA
VNFPARGIGARSIEAVEADSRGGGISLWAAACKGGKKYAAFVQLIEGLRAETEPLSLAETAELVVQRSGLIEHYKTERDGEDRIDNLNELANAAIAFSQENDDHSLTAFGSGITPAALASTESNQSRAQLTAFLAHAALEAGEHEAGASQDAVQLMTVHAAKGLEFHTVFITGLEEGLFPHDNAMNELDGLEEERRLMYVAITRARRQLYLTHSQYRLLHGQPRYGIPSRFLEEIPEALVQSIRPYRTAFASTYAAPPPTPSPASGGGLGREAVALSAKRLPFKVGARVSHVRYGEGVVGGYQGQGAETEIRITFPRIGDKWFILEYAKLTPC